MNIYPQDLGSRWHLSVARKRSLALLPHRRRGLLGGDGAPGPVRPLGAMGRRWTRGAAMDEDAAQTGVAALGDRPRRMTTLLGLHSLGMAAGAVATLLAGPDAFPATVMLSLTALASGSASALVPGWLFRRVHRALDENEVDDLFPAAQDDLDRAYLTLVRDVVRQSVPSEAEADLRTSLRALGEAIYRLPPGGDAVPADAAALRSAASAARDEAAGEADAVVAASLERQADALEQRASALERSHTWVRRSEALRRELLAQIEALRAGIGALYTGGADTAGLARLAESVRGVAREAVSVAEARRELDAPPVTVAGETPAPAPLRVRSGQGQG